MIAFQGHCHLLEFAHLCLLLSKIQQVYCRLRIKAAVLPAGQKGPELRRLVFLCLPFPLQHSALLWCQSPTIRNNHHHLPILSPFCLHFQIQSRSGNDRPMCWVLQEQALDWKSNGEPWAQPGLPLSVLRGSDTNRRLNTQ